MLAFVAATLLVPLLRKMAAVPYHKCPLNPELRS
jgi:hypothetical protein